MVVVPVNLVGEGVNIGLRREGQGAEQKQENEERLQNALLRIAGMRTIAPYCSTGLVASAGPAPL